MNIRSSTRGDGVVIGAAVLLFIASFLDTYGCDGPNCSDVPTAWDNLGLLMGVYVAGIAGAVLVVLTRALPQSQPRRVAGIELRQFGVALTIFSAWTALWTLFDPMGAFNDLAGLPDVDAGAGLILGLIASLLLAAAAVATPLVPALKAPLLGTPRPAAPQPYGGQPQGGYGYPGQPQPGGYGYPAQHDPASGPGGQQPFGQGGPAPYGQQPGGRQPLGQQSGQQPGDQQPAGATAAPTPAPGQRDAPAPAAGFAPFWFAVPAPRPLYGEDGSPAPIAELAPGTWYLAVDQHGSGLVAQTQDGRRGVLNDVSGIQRG
ncbi:hypothetical protein [Streptomyces sp. NPDC007088]|uniref:hypothetical protein n=1 Tax=Streptomyces sp. NPDC007088 TaxID=3364773 RepID=UPI00368B51CE